MQITTVTPPAPVWADVLPAARDIQDRMWTGLAGEQITGQDVADLLDQVAALLPADDFTFTMSMWQVATSTSDPAVLGVAEGLLDVVLRARAGARAVSCHIWAQRRTCTRDDIAGLLATGAYLARHHGPTA